MSNTILTASLIPNIVAHKANGNSFHDIGNLFGVTGQAVQTFMKRHNLKYQDARKVRKVKRLDTLQATINAAQADIARKTAEMRKIMGL